MVETHADVRFEQTDIRIGPVVWFLAGLGAMMAAVMVGLWFTAEWVFESERVSKEPEHPAAGERGRMDEADKRPPEPRIEGIGLGDASHSVTNSKLPTSAQTQQKREEEALRDGWDDAAKRHHPPIEEAMARFIEKQRREKK